MASGFIKLSCSSVTHGITPESKSFETLDCHYQDVVKGSPHTFLFYHRIISDSNRRIDAGISAYLLCSSDSSRATLVVLSALIQKLYPFRSPHFWVYPFTSTFSLGNPSEWTPALTVPTAILSAVSDPDLFDVEREEGMEPLETRSVPPSSPPFESSPLTPSLAGGGLRTPIFKGDVESKDGIYYGYLEVWLDPETFNTHSYLWRDDVWISLSRFNPHPSVLSA